MRPRCRDRAQADLTAVRRAPGRNGRNFSDVTLDDETLEAYDSSIAKVTCAVDYTFGPRALIGRLAEDGNMGRAASLRRLSRLRGGTITGRARYTVKPTATIGTDYIELLP